MPPRRIALLVEATEPGALNLCRAFREAGHEVVVLSRTGPPAEGNADVWEFGRPNEVHDVYPPGAPRDARAFYLLNGAGHKAARLGLGALVRPALLAAFDARLARPVRKRAAALVRSSGAEAVWGFWGIGSVPEFRALQLEGTRAALVNQFQTYPLGKAPAARPRPASPIEREVLGRLDGRAHASAQMERYLDAALRPRRGVDMVLPEAWGPWMVAKRRLPLLREQDGVPHVVHVGTTPLKARGSIDAVEGQLAALAREGLAVHAVEGFRAAGVTTFPRLGLRQLMTGELATFLTQFDCLALLYEAPPGLQWFAGNMPARFLSGLSAGVPMAVRRGLFGAVQEFLEREGNGVVYDHPRDLAAWLRDDAAVGRARKLAEALQREHHLARFLPAYERFLERALDARAGRPVS